MSFIYAADVWCTSCGEAIRARLTAEGTAPAAPDDESSYDSDNFPKGADHAAEAADYPEHCAAGTDCLEAAVDGTGAPFCGAWLENPLTECGVVDLLRAVVTDPDGKMTAVWVRCYIDQLRDHLHELGSRANDISL